MNKDYQINQPLKYKDKWLLFKDTIFSNLDIADCNDAINGICYTDKTIHECIETCDKSKDCGAGFYVESNLNNYCVPLNTKEVHQLNPAHKLRRKNIYPELSDNPVTTFINTKIFPFPPNEVNTVFYNDIVSLINTETGFTPSIIHFDEQGLKETDVTFDDGNVLSIQIRPATSSLDILLNSSPIQYGHNIVFGVPKTSLVMNYNKDNITWTIKGRLFEKYNPSIFQIIPISDENELGDIVKYGDKFTIKYGDKNTVELGIEHLHIVDTNDKGKHNTTFSFESRMNGYYCDKNKCKTIPIKDITKHGKSGKYNGNIVTRNKGCFGLCNYKTKQMNLNTPQNKHRIIIPIIFIIILISLSIFLFIIKK